jgi:hypothetical protein
MHEKYTDTISLLTTFARDNPDIEAIIMVGSQCRPVKPADAYSDLDAIVCTTDPGKYIDNADWINYFGNPVCSFIETTFDGDKERRVLKKLKRKELWTSVNCINNYLNKLLLQMIRHYVVICDGHEIRWPAGRFLGV